MRKKAEITTLREIVRRLSATVEAQTAILDDLRRSLDRLAGTETEEGCTTGRRALDERISVLPSPPFFTLSDRVVKLLAANGVVTNRDLCRMTEKDLRSIRNLGLKARSEISIYLRQRGLKLKEG